jgi:Ca-activated chloride channel homolog
MRVCVRWSVCAWVLASVAACVQQAPPEATSTRAERSLTVQAEVTHDELECVATEPEQVACGASGSIPEALDDGEPAGRAAFLVQRGERRFGLPLQSASYDSFVVGTVAETIVKQRYFNPMESAIEAVYVFPLPHDGAVFEYSMRVQDRRLHGEMKRRADARAIYETARQLGHSAGLLEQERPNVFTQRVANIPPGETIEVELRVVQPLARVDGRYELVLPTVVGPRYVSGTPTGPTPAGSFASDTDRVPDGSKITPLPGLGGQPSCPNTTIQVAIENGSVDDVRSKHHDIELHDESGVAHIALASGAATPDRDFWLSWSAGAERPRASLMVQPELDRDGGYFTLTVEPPLALPTESAVPRELVFVVDTSGSMSGEPIATAKAAMRKVLGKLAPRDVFQIVQFSQNASQLGSGFLPSTPAAVQRGLAFIDAMHGAGGTEMLAGARAALDMPRDPRRLRMVLLLTDGYIGNENEVFGAVRERIGDARLFTLGVGTSVNRHLLDGLARLGRGDVSYVSAGEGPERVVERFFERIDRPVLTDVTIDWGDFAVEDVEPRRLPDLFAGEPVVVFGRYRGERSGELTLRGRRAGVVERIPVAVDFAKPSASTAALSTMWARSRIARLSDEAIEFRAHQRGGDLEERITALALAHHVMTEYTAFVAVDDARAVQPGTQTEHVPLALPMAVSPQGVFGNDPMSSLGALSGARTYNAFGSLVRGTGDGGGGWAARGLVVGRLGSVGTIGHGAGGAVSGHGHRSGGHAGRQARVPRVRTEQLDVRGALSPEVIRRIVRRHLNEVRFCYEQALTEKSELQGRVSVKFVISPTGSVLAAARSSSTIADAKAEHCIVAAVRRWRFPTPEGGGNVVVTIPFVLEP